MRTINAPIILNLTSWEDNKNGSRDLYTYDNTRKQDIITTVNDKEFIRVYEWMPDDLPFYFFVHACNQVGEGIGVKYLANILNSHPELKNCRITIYSREAGRLMDQFKGEPFLASVDCTAIFTNNLSIIDFTKEPSFTKKELKDKNWIYTKFRREEEYYTNSFESNVNKAKGVITSLRHLGLLDLTNWAFISLGGGNGTELLYEIENSKAKLGYLIEYDVKSCDFFDRVIESSSTLIKENQYTISKREADLFDPIKFDWLKADLKERKPKGIIVTIHAVIHELVTRSKLKEPFDLRIFFDRIYALHERIVLIIREPGRSESWPDTVKIEVDNYEKFLEKLRKVRRLYFADTSYDFEETNAKYFVLKKDLAIEGLTKMFYDDDYELGEKITSCSYADIVDKLSEAGFHINEVEVFDTGSVRQNFKDFGVRASNPITGRVLPYPKCFTYTIASKGDIL